MKIVYIVGPYTAETEIQKTQNILRAKGAAVTQWLSGYVVICPHLNSVGFEKDLPLTNFHLAYLHLVSKVDRIHVIQGWETSPGSLAEIREALRLKKEITNNFSGTEQMRFLRFLALTKEDIKNESLQTQQNLANG